MNDQDLEEAADEGASYVEGAEGHVDAAALMAEARELRLTRQAYFHGTSKQLFAFLVANCLFLAGSLAAWTRAGVHEAGDPSTYINGLDTIRGTMIFALAIYGFWTAAFNIFFGQMKVWPYLLNAVLGLWVGLAGFMAGVGGENWDKAKQWLDQQSSKKMLDDLTVPLSTIAPGYWLLTLGGLLVAFVILNGLLLGRQTTGGSASEGGGSARRSR
jgi:hypothetical protein